MISTPQPEADRPNDEGLSLAWVALGLVAAAFVATSTWCWCRKGIRAGIRRFLPSYGDIQHLPPDYQPTDPENLGAPPPYPAADSGITPPPGQRSAPALMLPSGGPANSALKPSQARAPLLSGSDGQPNYGAVNKV